MKFVETEAKKTFEPVTFIVESADELMVLWHRINASAGSFLRSDYAHTGFDHDRDCQNAFSIWKCVDEAVSARGIATTVRGGKKGGDA